MRLDIGGIVSDFWPGVKADWRYEWLSLVFGASVLFVFSQAWLCPLFGYGAQSAAAGLIVRNFYYPFYLMSLGLTLICWRHMFSALWRTPLILSLVTLCALSYFWSIDPSGTLRRFVALSFTVLAGYALAARFSWARLTEVVALAFTVMMLGSAFLAIFIPKMGVMHELFPGAWRGMWLEKNNLGSCMAIGFVAAASAALHNPRRQVFWGLMAAGMVLLTILSTSKTSLVCLVLGMGGVGFIWLARRGPVLGILLTWLAVTVLLALSGLVLFAPEKLYLLLGKDATLTGRTFIWDGIARVMEDRPKLGYGYGVVWTDEGDYAPLAKITAVAGFRAYHAHSCWFETWLGMGIVGLSLWALVFAETWLKGLYRMLRGDGGYFALPLIGIYSLSSLTESITLSWNDLRWSLFVMVLVKLSLPRDEDAQDLDIKGWRRS